MQKPHYSSSKDEEYLKENGGGGFCLYHKITIFRSQRHMNKVQSILYINKIMLQPFDFIIYVLCLGQS